MPATSLRILHLSDIHFRAPAGIGARAKLIQREAPRRARVIRGAAWQRNLGTLLDDGAIDLVCITGDIADWGKPAEFEQGTRFIEDLLEVLSLPRSRLFVVPGNHDVDRSVADLAWAGIRRQAWSARGGLSDWMAGGPHPGGVEAGWRELVREREAAFWSWVEHDLGRPELLPSRSPHERLGYRVELSAELGLRAPLWILGLDTAWLAGDEHDAGKLLLTKDQVLLLGTDTEGLPLSGFRLALGHHPLAELADGNEARKLLADYADLYLHGHQHEALAAVIVDPDRRVVELAAGCLFEGARRDEHPNGFEVITLALDERGRPQRAELRFRSWSPRGGYWHDDSSIFRAARHGRLTLTWPGASERPSTPRPAPGARKVAPTRLSHGAPELFGREAELERLDRAWRDPGIRVLTIVAWGGVGKTALVNDWRNRLLAPTANEDGPEYVFDWSFYSQGTRDLGAVSADRFIHAALRFFGDPELAESKASGWEKGARLAELVGGRRSLLILDGLEPLQYPKGSSQRAGVLKEESISALLRGLALQNRGLCLVTTRVPVQELVGFEGTSAPRRELEQLSEASGAAFLRSLLGEVQATDEELREISRTVEGHALTLQLLGSYIRRALGDVRRWREIDFERANADQGGHAFRVIGAYVRWLAQAGLEGERQLAVLRLMGLFDRPADPGCILALREAPVIPGLSEALVGVDRVGWQLLIASLVEARLITTSEYKPEPVSGYDEASAKAAGKKGQPKGTPKPWPVPEVEAGAKVLDAHPLIREYFGARLRQTHEDGWREGHRRLYVHLCASVPYWPEGIGGLQPLYQAVVHGCAAGQVQEARDAVYRSRILRGERAYSTFQLGAISADLAAVACFFEGGWDRPSAEFDVIAQSWVLYGAAFSLRALGRLREALEPMRKSLEMLVEGEDWKNAAITVGGLSELELTLGRTRAAVDHAKQAVDHAERSGNRFERMSKRTTLADALLTTGEEADARELFEQAESMLAQQPPNPPQLYSLWGYRYCDLLLRPAERAAWQGGPVDAVDEAMLLARCAEVFTRATQTLAWAVDNFPQPFTIAVDHLTLGRAALYAALLRGETPITTAPSFADAHAHLEAAVAGLRKSGYQNHLPRGLLTRAWLHDHNHDPERARADLDEAWAIADRGSMPLFQADIQLHRARLFGDRDALAAARELITRHEYNRRLPELEDAEQTFQILDELKDRLQDGLELGEHRATIAIVIPPRALERGVELVREQLEAELGLDEDQVVRWVVRPGPSAREEIAAINRARDTLLAEKRLIWLRASSSEDLRFLRRAAPDLTAAVDIFADLRRQPDVDL